MDPHTVDAATFGRRLAGLGVNMLCRDVPVAAAVLRDVLGLSLPRPGADFGLARPGVVLIQRHAHSTFGRHPLRGPLPEAGVRGAGVQLHRFEIDRDAACQRAAAYGARVVDPPADKPHGLREATILGPEGHAFLPAVARP